MSRQTLRHFRIAFVVLALVVGYLIGSYANSYHSPYAIFLDEITPYDLWMCQRDENCMDLNLSTDLPTRSDVHE